MDASPTRALLAWLACGAAACGGSGSAPCVTRADCDDGEVCVDGRCAPGPPGRDAAPPDAAEDASSCAAPTTPCGALCVNLSRDPMNCGRCGRSCSAMEVCMDGDCVLTCEAPRRPCDGSCVDIATDAMHCGDCDRACGPDQDCLARICVDRCTPSIPPHEVCDGRDNDCDGTTDLPDCQPGLIAWYRFEDATGGVLDSSGNAHHGAAEGSVVRMASGRVGSAVALDGDAATRIQVPDHPAFAFGSAFTAEAWISPDDCVRVGSDHNTVAAIEGSFLLAFQTTCAVANYVNNGVTWVGDFPMTTLGVGRFTHFAVSYDGTTIRSFVDGIQLGPGTAFTGSMPDRTVSLWIGARADCGCVQTFRGRIDELKIWNVTRTEQQVCEDAGGTYDGAGRRCDLLAP